MNSLEATQLRRASRRPRCADTGGGRRLAVRGSLLVASMLLMGSAGENARRVHDAAVVLDTHFDTPANLGRPGWSFADRHDVRDGDQVDLPRMVEGGVDGGFFVVFTPQGPRDAAGVLAARDFALARAVQVRELAARHPGALRFVTSAAEARDAVSAGKRFVFMSMENGSPVEGDLSWMRAFQRLGLTMIGAAHTKNNGLADSATDKPEWNGLSAKGRAFVAEANRLGLLLDASHSSDEALRQMVALSRAPIILSHSGMRAVFDHPRNITDDDLRALAAKGGVVQINAFSGYMVAQPANPDRDAAMRSLMARFAANPSMTERERAALAAERRAIEKRWPAPRATLDDVVAHILHAVRVAGVDHVGVSGDFDGDGGVEGFDSVADFPKLTAALLARGLSTEDIAKVWGGNALRVLERAQAAAEPGTKITIPQTL